MRRRDLKLPHQHPSRVSDDGGVRVRAGGVEDAAGYKQPTDPQMKDLFLPFRCFCTRKDVRTAPHTSNVAAAVLHGAISLCLV